jgi:Gram-negative porin
MSKTTGSRTGLLGLLGALALMVFLPMGTAAQGLTVTGYADFEANLKKVGSGDSEFTYDNHHFNLILEGYVADDFFVSSEIEYEHGGDETAMEFGYLGYTGIKDIRIMAGKFLLPFGRFNLDLHPTTLNKIPGRPLGMSHVVPVGFNDQGVWVQGAKAINDDARFVFDVYTVDGLLGEDGGDIRDLRDNIGDEAEEIDGVGHDNDKAFGGRFGFQLPFKGLDFGVSGYTGKYAVSESGRNLRINMFDVDAQYMKNDFSIRGEYAHASQDATGGDLSKSGGWLQAAYMVSPKVEPVIRYSFVNMGGKENDATRLAFGVSFHLAAAAIIRVAYMRNMEETGFKTDNDGIVTQFNVIF